MTAWRRASFVFLCATPFLAAGLTASRALRVPLVHQLLGVTVFAAVVVVISTLGRWRSEAGQSGCEASVAGALLVAPFALIGLFWVGLGTPWEASVAENQMRYLVLTAMAVAEVMGFVLAARVLGDAGERTCATLAGAAMALAGPAYLVWNVYQFGVWTARARGELPAALLALDGASDVLLFFAGALTYLAGGLLAASLGRVKWLGARASATYVAVCGVSVFLLASRGLVFLAPAELAAPWYATPGFIAGIPAVPYIVPALLGAVLLRRAAETASSRRGGVA